MAARAAESIVEVKMAKGGVEVVAPHQANHASAEPNAFGVTRGTVDRLGGLGKFIRSALVIPGGIGRVCGRLAGLILGGRCPALGNGASNADHECQPGESEMTQNRNLKHPLTHKFPD
jgi:hypothetical protein